MPSKNSDFYSNLKIHKLSVSKLVAEKKLFTEVPENWHILVSDIRDSSGAIKNGKQNEVNLTATGSVIAILNLAFKSGIRVPFFFGGDGAVLLIPEELLDESLAVLYKHKVNTSNNFGLHLRIGHVPVREIYDQGLDLKIARGQVTGLLSIPLALGKGLQYAEQKIKEAEESEKVDLNNVELDLTGMECKWEKVEPPRIDHEVMSLIIDGCQNEDPSQIYSEILEKIDAIYGPHTDRTPITVNKLKPITGLRQIRNEMKLKQEKSTLIQIFKHWLIAMFGEIYLKNTATGRNYMRKLVELTDNLTIDGRINTVITGTFRQRKSLLEYLDRLENEKKIKYGYHVSRQSIMSCYVRDIHTDDHIHFVDGADGGYTKAANNLKAKLS
ncbi:DUF3095 family protein [Christiangramia crocea]|uniref:DUF3095 domain-containing protein n=1 Tax=Christiangramia crocea TaxID=2904124 RepID=A0A9X1UVG7_9FLAO|nr:DUF3095 family protein [Gramella crocea]MCG9971142.1 DUF3095 domain-containing protein [Gramella crocea]